jgi:hypothetical protein
VICPALIESNCSFAGIYGSKARDKARIFLQSGLYDSFGSDAHTSEHLEELLKRGMQTVKLPKHQAGRD